jgi:redox-sensitive bicupin YhaK (pirin superfamily)
MIRTHRSHERGHANHGWLDTYHTFSFADYYDPAYMGFSALRVVNEDWVAPGSGFPTHGHRDMEILTYMLDGALEHKDSMGNGSTIRPGEIQKMSAGTGVRHSEYNPSASERAHLLQIWIEPNRKGVTPAYEQNVVALDGAPNRLHLIASPEGGDGAVSLRQDARVFAVRLHDGTVTQTLPQGRRGFVQVARGEVNLNGHALLAGDSAFINDEAVLELSGKQGEALLFDLP